MLSLPAPRKNPLRQLLLRMLDWLVPNCLLQVRGASDSRAVHVTFDDGPDPETTPRILDVLRKHGVRATFFVVGQKAAEHPQLLRRLAMEGHTIGGHTYSHETPGRVSGGQLMEEIRKTNRVIEETVGYALRLFRPPYGKLTVGKMCRLWFARHRIVLWNQDPRDFALSDPEHLLDWFRQQSLSAGDILLLHDTSPITADSLDEIISRLRRSGWQLEPLD